MVKNNTLYKSKDTAEKVKHFYVIIDALSRLRIQLSQIKWASGLLLGKLYNFYLVLLIRHWLQNARK